MVKVIAYVDGFNLYFGLKEKRWRQFYWLNVRLLIENLLKPNQQLVATKYFTARVTGSPEKEKRQATFLEALETLPDFEVYYGKYLRYPRQCPHCGFQDEVPREDVGRADCSADAFRCLHEQVRCCTAGVRRQ